MSFLDAFKSSMLDIVEETKKGNAEFADSLLDPLFERLDEELSVRADFSLVSTALNDISGHLHLVYSRFENEAQRLFSGVENEILQTSLVKYYANQLQAIENNKLPLACKSLFQQIETLLNYLMSAKGCLNDIRSSEELMKKFKIVKNSQGYINFSLKSKLFIASFYYSEEFKNIVQNNISLAQHYYNYIRIEFDTCYELRHIDSHGMIFDQGDAEVVASRAFNNNARQYIGILNEFIKKLTTLSISAPQPVALQPVIPDFS